MNEGEPELEVLVVSESIGLSIEDLDFVVEPLEGSCGDSVIEVGQQTTAVTVESFGELYELFEFGCFGAPDPGIEESLRFAF
jgi:hypothetical protein